jgi:hypothetical protein
MPWHPEAIGFLVIDRPHVGLGDGSGGAQDALLAAAGARAIAGDKRLVVATDHEVIAERGLAGVRGVAVVVEAEEFLRSFLRSIRQQPREHLRGGQLRVEVLGFACHAQRIVIAADLDAFAAAFAQIGDEDGEQAAGAGRLGLE